MINLKFANLASFFSKKQYGNASYPNTDLDCASSAEKKSLNHKNTNPYSSSPAESNSIFKNQNNNKNIKNCKNENEILKNSSSERNEKTKNTKGYLTNNNLLLGFLPALYLISSVAIILILLSIKAFNGNRSHFLSLANTAISEGENYKDKNYQKQNSNFNLQLNTDINKNSKNKYNDNKNNEISNALIKLHKINLTSATTIKIPNFYDLQKINPTAFNIYISLSCGSSLAISFLLFSVLKQRFKVPEFQAHSFKLNILLLFSLASNFMHLARAAAPPLFERYFRLGEEFDPELENQFKQSVFLSHIFFTILFALDSLLIVNLIRDKNCDGNKINFFSHAQSEAQENKWFLYKYITLFYLCVFTLLYVLVLLQEAKIVSFGPFEACLQEYYQPVTAMFPYFIQIINAVLVFTFYFELKFVNMALARNLEVDYLFEEEENKDGI